MEKIEDHSDAFNYAIALWYWLSHNYNGKSCEKYAKMCFINCEYKLENIPSIDFDEPNDEQDENETIKFIYNDLDEENYEHVYDDFCHYMDNKWDEDAC